MAKNYTYKNQSVLQQIASHRSRISILEWDTITGVVPTYYAYEEIDKLEREISELQKKLHDEMMPETRKVS